jgi:hypothetical protein
MSGKVQEEHPRWLGECEDGHGYLTTLYNGKREFVHRVVMMEALGVPSLPRNLVVHHIDGDPKNNTLDNLALVTRAGHKQIHSREAPSLIVQSRASTISAIMESMTSPLKTTQAI